MKLSELNNGESAIIVKVLGHGGFRKRIMEMGFVRGQEVKSVMNSPLNDPVKYSVMGYDVSLRKSEAAMIEVLTKEDAETNMEPAKTFESYSYIDETCNNCLSCISCPSCNKCNKKINKKHNLGKLRHEKNLDATSKKNVINIALVGNPNSGKTSLFNALSGGSEHVGNYSGVTVDAKMGSFNYKGYRFNITDLPGTYSLSAYSPEEVYVRRDLFDKMPDVIVNSVVASNLERNLYLTTELIDLSQRTVVALNMYDELAESGAKLDYKHLGAMMGVPMVPTVAKTKKGLNELLNTIIDLFEGRNNIARHVHINYGTILEPKIKELSEILHQSNDLPQQFPARYWAIKLLEGDSEVKNMLKPCLNFDEWIYTAEKLSKSAEKQLNKDIETAISDSKYGFITGALQETFEIGSKEMNRKSKNIDKLVANKWLGFPLFLFFMWIMFMATFKLGAYPQSWIQSGFDLLGSWFWDILPENALRDLIVNGIIGGVGSVAVFLPNILILYLFISLMEDSGYMARAAFIMDKLMHKMGLHGKSFIPLIMGFGCNVPAIMATRTIESKSSRIITILITPFMSCSARLPLYILLTGTFFPKHAATILIALYLLGGIVAILTARLLRRTRFKTDETPFVMELPPYRWPTLLATVKHMWDKCEQYLKKIGTVVFLATIVIWFLSYYPRPKSNLITNTNSDNITENTIATHLDTAKSNVAQTNAAQYIATNSDVAQPGIAQPSSVQPNSANLDVTNSAAQSYIGKIGKFIEPVMLPLGINWRASVAIISSIPAKELVVSTLGVLYNNTTDQESQQELLSQRQQELQQQLQQQDQKMLQEQSQENEQQQLQQQLQQQQLQQQQQQKQQQQQLQEHQQSQSLSQALIKSGDFTPQAALAFMVFILLFFPCIATLASIANETGKISWALFTAVYNTTIAWIIAYITYLIAELFF